MKNIATVMAITTQRRDPSVALTTHLVHETYACSQYVHQYHARNGAVRRKAIMDEESTPRYGIVIAGRLPLRCSAMAPPTALPTMALANQMLMNGFFAACGTCSGGGWMYDRITGCSVTTLMKIDTIPQLATIATF